MGAVTDTEVGRVRFRRHTYYVYITYEVDGAQYTHRLRSTDSSLLEEYPIGREVDLLYDPQDPDNADFPGNITEEEIRTTKVTGYIFLPIALGIWLVAFGLKIILSRKDGKISLKAMR